jgi:hypothetical protein
MYERHWGDGFRGLFDNASPEWASTQLAEKVIALKGFAAAGVSAEELISHYRQTLAEGGRTDVLGGLASTMRDYRSAGYWPPLPADLEAAMPGAPEDARFKEKKSEVDNDADPATPGA